MDGGERIEFAVLGGIGDIAAADWDACAGDGGARPVDPFTTHRFLAALEDSRLGRPRHRLDAAPPRRPRRAAPRSR